MIDQAIIDILDKIKRKATDYQNNIRTRQYEMINGLTVSFKDGEYFNALGAKANIQQLIDDMVEYEHIRKYGVKE
jgi:alpha-acetolactate decarboxylase